MTNLTIATIDACAPKPFTAAPFLALVLDSQVGTAARYVQEFPADASTEYMEAEARALEMTGTIDQATLDADWKLDLDAIAAETAQIEGDAEDAAFNHRGQDVEDVDNEQEIEPLV